MRLVDKKRLGVVSKEVMEKERQTIMTTKLTWEEYQRIKDIKILDLEFCDYWHVNILNLGNVLGCELVRRRVKRGEEPPKPNRPYDLANCYLCGKELKSASKKGSFIRGWWGGRGRSGGSIGGG
ncbi:3623_t:CDS:2, partial [Ambispora leptoticha]